MAARETRARCSITAALRAPLACIAGATTHAGAMHAAVLRCRASCWPPTAILSRPDFAALQLQGARPCGCPPPSHRMHAAAFYTLCCAFAAGRQTLRASRPR